MSCRGVVSSGAQVEGGPEPWLLSSMFMAAQHINWAELERGGGETTR